MKIILRKSVAKIGEEDTITEVSDGYARNYLLPRGLAVVATKKEESSAKSRLAEKEKKIAEKKAEFEELSKKLSALSIEIAVDAGEGGKLFGSVTAQDISLAVLEKAGIDLDKKKIELAEPLKILGEHTVLVKLFQDISANLKIKLTAK